MTDAANDSGNDELELELNDDDLVAVEDDDFEVHFIKWTDEMTVDLEVTAFTPDGGRDINDKPCAQVEGPLLRRAGDLAPGELVRVTGGPVKLNRLLKKANPRVGDRAVIKFVGVIKVPNGTMKDFTVLVGPLSRRPRPSRTSRRSDQVEEPPAWRSGAFFAKGRRCMTSSLLPAYDRIIDQLRSNGNKVRQTRPGQAAVQCPAHEDRTASLSVTGIEGQVLVHCHAGCDTHDVLAALGMAMGDLFDNRNEAVYRYDDHRKVRRWYDDDGKKRFSQFGTKNPTSVVPAREDQGSREQYADLPGRR